MCLCGSALTDTIINFGENLSDDAITRGFKYGRGADLLVACGASLTVSPSCDMVGDCPKNGGKLVIINLQRTPYDSDCALRIFHRTDEVWSRVMKLLNIPVPPFALERRLLLWQGDNKKLCLAGADGAGLPATWLSAVGVAEGADIKERYDGDSTGVVQVFSINPPQNKRTIVLFPFGHYNECPVALDSGDLYSLPTVLKLRYIPATGKWEKSMEPDARSTVNAFLTLIGNDKSKLAAHGNGNNNNNNNNNNNHDGNDNKNSKKPEITGGFAVYPKRDCPHVEHLDLNRIVVDCGAACESCNDSSENWLCLLCSSTRCSRYVKGHMLEHVKEAHNGDAILASYSDFSFWCTACDSYITTPYLQPVLKGLELSKFAEEE
jgi:hypothetical protein